MPNLPAAFQDGTILFAAPLNTIRTFLGSTLAAKATKRGDIAIASAAAGAADNIVISSPPTNGSAILVRSSNGDVANRDFPLSSDSLGPNSVIADKILGGAVTGEKIPNGAIGKNHLAQNAAVSPYTESGTPVRTIRNLTQAQFDALTDKDANTFYVIT